MALSQLQCLDDNNVNPRTSEAKPEFLYCENQRLALEALLADGREAFFKCLDARGLRGFLSDPELDALSAAAEPYDPGADLYPEDAEEGDPPLSLHYWPDLSDTSVPEMDLGWPDTEAYRGVTRATIHTQPPLDGQAHVKEVVRKMIAQAQKVRGAFMDFVVSPTEAVSVTNKCCVTKTKTKNAIVPTNSDGTRQKTTKQLSRKCTCLILIMILIL